MRYLLASHSILAYLRYLRMSVGRQHTELPVGSASAGGCRPPAGDVGHAGTSAPVRRRILPDRRITWGRHSARCAGRDAGRAAKAPGRAGGYRCGRQKVEAIQAAYGQLLTYEYNQEEITAPSGQGVQMALFHYWKLRHSFSIRKELTKVYEVIYWNYKCKIILHM